MDLLKAKQRINFLNSEIKRLNEAYYREDEPLVSDFIYDEMFRELKSLEAQFPEFKTENSVTQNVGSVTAENFSQHKHKFRLYSLDNSNNLNELSKWYERVKKDLNCEPELVCELKIDGLAVALSYENGILRIGATRGNGIVGENITQNLKMVKGIVPKLSSKIDAEVRGEVYMPVSSFYKLNLENEKKSEKIFANPRNAAAGSLRQLDSEVTKKRDLHFFAYAGILNDKSFKKHSQILDFFVKEGFNVNPYRKIVKNIQGARDFCEYWKDERFNLDYPTDGAVIKINDISLQNELGYTARAPKWATAFKFPPEEIETELLEIETGVGKTGAITPVAIMKPVSLAGSIVKRASLHNFDEIQKLGINIGDTILIKKAAEIIPKVIKVVKHQEGKSAYFIPKNCPSCNTSLIKPEGEVNLYCPNIYACPAQIEAKIEYFASKEAMDIDGVGENIVKQLIEKGLIKDYADLFVLSKVDFLKLDLIKEKSATNLFEAIQNSKKPSLTRFLTALSIRHVGKETAEILAQNFSTLENLEKANFEQLANINGIGEKIAKSVIEFFTTDFNKQLLQKFKQFGVIPQGASFEKISNILDGKIFVLTGTLSRPRTEIEQIIKEHGGKTSSSVSKKTDFVLIGEDAGSKAQKAQDLGVKIISESQFFEMI